MNIRHIIIITACILLLLITATICILTLNKYYFNPTMSLHTAVIFDKQLIPSTVTTLSGVYKDNKLCYTTEQSLDRYILFLRDEKKFYSTDVKPAVWFAVSKNDEVNYLLQKNVISVFLKDQPVKETPTIWGKK